MRWIAHIGLVIAAIGATTVAAAAPISSEPNSLTVYPRRPGAKFEDIEARPHEPVRLPIVAGEPTTGIDVSLERWARERVDDVPAGWSYADARDLEHANQANGFVAHPGSTGEVLHLVLRTSTSLSTSVASFSRTVCTLTDPTDGTQFLPFLPPPLSLKTPKRLSSTTTTVASTAETDAYVAIDGRRGPMYARCGLEVLSLPLDASGVWRIDVA